MFIGRLKDIVAIRVVTAWFLVWSAWRVKFRRAYVVRGVILVNKLAVRVWRQQYFCFCRFIMKLQLTH